MRQITGRISTILCLLLPLPLSAAALILTLPRAIQIGMQNNLELKKKRMDIQFKKYSAREAWRAFLPQLGLSLNRAITVRTHEQDSRQHRLELSIDQLLFDGGKTSSTSDLATAEWKIAAKLYQTEARAVRLQILTAFAGTIGGRENVRIYKDFLKASSKELELANLEVKLGTTTTLDRDEVATRYESAKLDLLQSSEEYQSALIQLRKLLRLPIRSRLKLIGNVGDGFTIQKLKYSEKMLFNFARNHRIDFIRSLLSYRKMLFHYQSIRRSWLPDISLSSKFFVSGPTLSPTDKGYSFYLYFNFPLFGSPVSGNSAFSGGDGKTATSRISISPVKDISYLRTLAQSRSAVYFSRLERRELPEQIKREIRLAKVALTIARRKFDIREKKLAILRKRIKLLELKIKLGESKRLDLAKARIELYRARVERINGVVSYISTAFKMETTVGLKPGELKLFKSSVFTFH